MGKTSNVEVLYKMNINEMIKRFVVVVCIYFRIQKTTLCAFKVKYVVSWF